MWESIVAHLTAGTLPPNDTRPAWALPALWAAVTVDSPSWVALTGQCTLVVKGCQGPGGVLAESGGCLGAVETKTTHGDIPRVPRNGPNLPLPTCSLKPCFGEGFWLWSLGKNGRTPNPQTHSQ